MADFKERPILSVDEENNITLNHSLHSTQVEKILEEAFPEIQPLDPPEETATYVGICKQYDDTITDRNINAIRNLIQDSRVCDPSPQNSRETIIISDEIDGDDISGEKICSSVNNKEGADRTNQNDVFCDLCLYGDIKTKATHYCKVCDVPEPLCNDCAKQHIRHKWSRDHELCDDIREFLNHQKGLNPKANETKQKDVFCDPCLYGNVKTKATHYCKTCDVPEPLCNDCTKQHVRQKWSRDHELCDDIREFLNHQNGLSAKVDQTDQEDNICNPCLYGDIKTKATHYCKTCDVPEPLCNNCAKQHTRQKSSRDHELCDDIRELLNHQKGLSARADRTNQNDVFCDPCLYGNIKTKATHYCRTCDVPEPLCNDCTKQHTRQKSSRDHKLCDDIREFLNHQKGLIARADCTNQNDVFCDPCLYGDIKTKATHYCKTCDDPEPLCNNCAKQHTRQKSSRDHKLCDDIREFISHQKGLIARADRTNQNDVFCDPCLYGDIKTKATHYCKTCDVPEPLCNDCAKQHTRQKWSRDHELCDDIREFHNHQKGLSANADQRDQQEIFCDPCLYGGIKNKATHLCKTCDVPNPLCYECAKQHTRQKLSRDHELCDNITQFQNNQKAK